MHLGGCGGGLWGCIWVVVEGVLRCVPTNPPLANPPHFSGLPGGSLWDSPGLSWSHVWAQGRHFGLEGAPKWLTGGTKDPKILKKVTPKRALGKNLGKAGYLDPLRGAPHAIRSSPLDRIACPPFSGVTPKRHQHDSQKGTQSTLGTPNWSPRAAQAYPTGAQGHPKGAQGYPRDSPEGPLCLLWEVLGGSFWGKLASLRRVGLLRSLGDPKKVISGSILVPFWVNSGVDVGTVFDTF